MGREADTAKGEMQFPFAIVTLGIVAFAAGYWTRDHQEGTNNVSQVETVRLADETPTAADLGARAARERAPASVRDSVETATADAGRNMAGDEPRDAVQLADCMSTAIGNPESLAQLVESFHRRAVPRCNTEFRTLGGPPPEELSLRGRCGRLSETLWTISNDELQPFLQSLRALSADGPSVHSLLSQTRCEEQSDDDFAAMAHVATLLPHLVDPSFIVCAIERESMFEGFALWTLIDAANSAGISLDYLKEREFLDERTLRRLEAGSSQHRTGE